MAAQVRCCAVISPSEASQSQHKRASLHFSRCFNIPFGVANVNGPQRAADQLSLKMTELVQDFATIATFTSLATIAAITCDQMPDETMVMQRSGRAPSPAQASHLRPVV